MASGKSASFRPPRHQRGKNPIDVLPFASLIPRKETASLTWHTHHAVAGNARSKRRTPYPRAPCFAIGKAWLGDPVLVRWSELRRAPDVRRADPFARTNSTPGSLGWPQPPVQLAIPIGIDLGVALQRTTVSPRRPSDATDHGHRERQRLLSPGAIAPATDRGSATKTLPKGPALAPHGGGSNFPGVAATERDGGCGFRLAHLFISARSCASSSPSSPFSSTMKCEAGSACVCIGNACLLSCPPGQSPVKSGTRAECK